MTPRTRLEGVINHRRVELGLRWRDVLAAADDMAPETLRRIRTRGTAAVDALSVGRVERALRFAPGSLAAVERGGDPKPVDGSPPHAPSRDVDDDDDTEEGVLRWETDSQGRRVYWMRRTIHGSIVEPRVTALHGEDEQWARENISAALDAIAIALRPK